MPVMRTVAVPVCAVALAASVSLLVVAVLAALNVGVTPSGNPLMERATVPVNPFNGVTRTVVFADVDWVMLRFPGAAPRVKLGAALIVRATGTEAVADPWVPVTTTV